MSLMAQDGLPRIIRLGRAGRHEPGRYLSPPTRYFAKGTHRSDSILGNPGTEFLYAGGGLVHAWPAAPDENEYARVRDSNVETLLIGGTLDFATPAQSTRRRELLPHLPNGHQVVLSELGHTTSFWTYEPEANKRLLNTFLDSGKVDRSLYTPAKVDFTPEVTHTALGKGFAATMIALPVIVLLSLLMMWRRSRKRGRIGRKSSAVLRSVFALVLGLGGWFAGVVIALVAFPSLPLDDALLAVLSIGVPIGLGIYLAWVDRDRAARTIGLSTAMVGALCGAWLGYHAASGLLAVITTIVGAALGANLTLLALDITRDRPMGEIAESAKGAPSGRPGLILGAIGRRDLNSRPPAPRPGGGHCRGWRKVAWLRGFRTGRRLAQRASSAAFRHWLGTDPTPGPTGREPVRARGRALPLKECCGDDGPAAASSDAGDRVGS